MTVRWVNTDIEGTIGPDLNLTLEFKSENTIRGTDRTKNKCLYQGAFPDDFTPGNDYRYTINGSVEEEDPFKSYGPAPFDGRLKAESSGMPRNGVVKPIKHTATDDNGPFGIRTATFSFNCHW